MTAVVEGSTRSSEIVRGYRLARQAQDERFNSRPGAGCVDVSRPDTEEYREWFAGEERVTFKGYLQHLGAERRAAEVYMEQNSDEPIADAPSWFITPESAFQLPGADLRVLADGGDVVAVAEIGRRAVARSQRRLLRGVVPTA